MTPLHVSNVDSSQYKEVNESKDRKYGNHKSCIVDYRCVGWARPRHYVGTGGVG